MQVMDRSDIYIRRIHAALQDCDCLIYLRSILRQQVRLKHTYAHAVKHGPLITMVVGLFQGVTSKRSIRQSRLFTHLGHYFAGAR